MIIDIHKQSSNHYLYKNHHFYYGSEGFKYSTETPPSIARDVYRAFLNVTQEPEDVLMSALYQCTCFRVTIVSIYNTMRVVETKTTRCCSSVSKRV